MKVFAAILLLCLATFPAAAEDGPHKVAPCAPVYGTWRTAYVMDKYGNPQPLPPSPGWDGLIMEARIDKDKAVLTWYEGKRMTFKRWNRFTQDEFHFGGLSDEGGYAEASTNYYAFTWYPNDGCHIKVLFEAEYRAALNKSNQDILMERIE